MNHQILVPQHQFERIISKQMPFLIRENDSDFQARDGLTMCEYVDGEGETGRFATARIVFVTNRGQKEENVVIGLAKVQAMVRTE